MPSITRADSRADQKTSLTTRTLCALALALVAGVVNAAPIKVWAWSPTDSRISSDMTGMVRVYPDAKPADVARQLAALPAGSRVLCMLGFTEILATHPSDACRRVDAKGKVTLTKYPGPWCDQGAVVARQQVEKFFDGLKAAGVPSIDALVLDNETTFWAGRYITADGANVAAIEADPRFPVLSKRLALKKLNKLAWGSTEYYRWNEVVQGDFDAALHKAVAQPFLARWPKAMVSNYGSAPIERARMTPDMSGLGIVHGGMGFGTHSSMSFYGEALQWIRGRSFAGTQLSDSAFDMFRMNVHRVRATRASGLKLMPWIATRSLGCNGEGNEPGSDLAAYRSPIANTVYWDENVIQLVMHGCDTVLLFNPAAWRKDQNPALWNRVDDQQCLASVVSNLNARLGTNAGDSRWFSLPGLQDRVMATGRAVTGGTLWRFSFAPDVSSVVVTLKSGEVREILREEGSAGAWYFEASNQPLAAKKDGSDVAWAEASKGSAFPDVDGDGALSNGDLAVLNMHMGERDSSVDLDGDGVITSRDADFFVSITRSWRDQGTSAAGVRPGSVVVAAAR